MLGFGNETEEPLPSSMRCGSDPSLLAIRPLADRTWIRHTAPGLGPVCQSHQPLLWDGRSGIAVVVFVFIAAERRRLGSYWWLPVGAVLTVGVSLGLPLLLYLLEDKTALVQIQGKA